MPSCFHRVKGADWLFLFEDPLAEPGDESTITCCIAPIDPETRTVLAATAGAALQVSYRGEQGTPGEADYVPKGWTALYPHTATAGINTSLEYQIDAVRTVAGMIEAVDDPGIIKPREFASL